MRLWLYFVLHWSTELLVWFDDISDSSHDHLISSFGNCTVSKHPFTVRDTFPSYYNSNYVVWHSPLKLNICPFSSSKHAFTGFCLCMTTASGSVQVFPSHTLPPRKINPLSRMRQWGWALTLQAVCNQHGVVEETPRDAVKPRMTQRRTETQTSPPSVWRVNVDGWLDALRSVQSATVDCHWI